MAQQVSVATTEYPFGHEPRELDRLTFQARMFEPITQRLFEAAGPSAGMRVLDVGSGSGDVAFLARKLVGATGEVVGLDKSREAIETATARARIRRYENVRFIEADVMDCDLAPEFDAVVGRLVLMYTPDPVEAVRRLAACLRPGGLLVFQEFDMSAARSVPAVPLYERSGALIRGAMSAAGADVNLGLKLRGVFQAAGLAGTELCHESLVASGPGHPAYRLVAEVMRSLLPVIGRFGLAAPEDVEVDTLAARLEAEVLAVSATLVSPALVGAWARKG